jgi:hypothetical protein
MTEKTGKGILDLDELFGQARAVKVRWKSQEYELLRMEGIDPKQAMRFQKMQRKAMSLQNISADDFSDEDAEKLEELFDDMLKVLCKNLPLTEMPFLAKTNIIMFYVEETQPKNALKTALKKTGVTSSAG